MNRRYARRREQGMTLVELLVVIVILGVISFALTESIIVGLRTTEGTGARVSNSSASQAFATAFTSDVQSAEKVFADDGGSCATSGDVFLHLRWTETSVVIPTTTSTSTTSSTAPAPTTTTTLFAPASELRSVEKRVSYALDPPTGLEQNLFRWVCSNDSTGSGASKIIGHFSGQTDTPVPVEVFCDDADSVTDPDLDVDDPCPVFDPNSAEPVTAAVFLSTESGTADDVLVDRRSA